MAPAQKPAGSWLASRTDDEISSAFPGNPGWGTTFDGRPTALWYPPYPLILTNGQDSSFGVTSNQLCQQAVGKPPEYGVGGTRPAGFSRNSIRLVGSVPSPGGLINRFESLQRFCPE